jgi:hypothetical protein
MIYRPRGLGDMTSDNPYVFVDDAAGAPAALPCYSATFMGPLPPGASYCASPGVPTFPATSASGTIIAGVPDRAVYTAGGVLLAIVLLGVLHK